MTMMGADKANDKQMFKCARARVYARVCLTLRCKITTWLNGEQVAVASTKMVFSRAPPLRAGKATHVIVMECVQSFILILGTPGGGVGWVLWGKRGSLGSHWLPISQLGLSASRLGSHLSLHLFSFPPHKSHTLNCLFFQIHKWCVESYWLCLWNLKTVSFQIKARHIEMRPFKFALDSFGLLLHAPLVSIQCWRRSKDDFTRK